MTPEQYLDALFAAGVRTDLPVEEIDRQAAALLKITRRTARFYRSGGFIPEWRVAHLEALARSR